MVFPLFRAMLDVAVLLCRLVFPAHPLAQLDPLADQALMADVDLHVGVERRRRRGREEIHSRRAKRLDHGANCFHRRSCNSGDSAELRRPAGVAAYHPLAVDERPEHGLGETLLLGRKRFPHPIGMVGQRAIRAGEPGGSCTCRALSADAAETFVVGERQQRRAAALARLPP